MDNERKQVKLTMSCEMYEELQERAKRMSISVPAMCCYILGEKLAQMRLAEGAGLDLEQLRRVDCRAEGNAL